MAYTIQVGSFALSAANNITISHVDYDPSTPLNLNALEVGRRPGAKLVSSVYGTREILVRGVVTGDSLDDVQSNFDAMKLAIIGTNLNLDIYDGVVNRRFIVHTKGEIKVKRDPWDVTIIRFELVFVALDPPFGIDAALGASAKTSTRGLTASGISSEQYSASVTFSGTAPPDLVTSIVVSQSGSLSDIEVVDPVSGRTLQVSGTFANNDVFKIDSTNFTVSQNLVPIPFSGQFPAFLPGSNTVKINFNTRIGNVLDQVQNGANSPFALTLAANRYAQSFQVSQTCSVTRLALVLAKIGAGANFTITIQTDSAGTPSGTNVTNGSVVVTAAEVSVNAGWVYINLSPPISLTVSTTYWLVITPSSNSLTDYTNLYTSYPGTYANGKFRKSINNGTVYADVGAGDYDWAFKIYRGSVAAGNTTLVYESYAELFVDTTYKDAGATTAEWNTSTNRLILPKTGETVLAQQTTDATSYGVFQGTGRLRIAQSFNEAAHVITKAKFKLSKIGSPTRNYRVEIQTNNAGEPSGTVVATSSTVNGADIPGVAALVTFAFATPFLTTGSTTYWLVLTADDTTPVGGACIVAQANNVDTGYGNGTGLSENDSPAWTGIGADYVFEIDYDDYIPANNIGQSLAVDSNIADMLAMQIDKTDTTPATTSVAYSASGDGTNFQAITPGTFSENSWTPVNTIGIVAKFKATLTGTVLATPYVSALALYWAYGIALDATTVRAAQSFTPAVTGNIRRVELYVYTVGAPGNITLRVETNSSGSPSGTLVNASATKTLAAPTAGSWQWLSFEFPADFSLTGGTKYWLVASAGATVNATNKYLLRANAALATEDGQKSTDSGSSYPSINKDLMFQVYSGSGGNFAANVTMDYTKRYL